jgi:hypothetical protein
MKMKRHCDLCDHQKLSLKEGSLCGLTNKKPSFNRTCVRVCFDKNLVCLLEDLHINFEDQINLKKKSSTSFIIKPILGIVVIMIGYFLWQYILSVGYIAFIPAVIIAMGAYLIRNPFTQRKLFNTQITKIENQLFQINEVLKMYHITYTTKVTFSKEVHGVQKAKANIKISK